jgi:hypothetical protein
MQVEEEVLFFKAPVQTIVVTVVVVVERYSIQVELQCLKQPMVSMD